MLDATRAPTHAYPGKLANANATNPGKLALPPLELAPQVAPPNASHGTSLSAREGLNQTSWQMPKMSGSMTHRPLPYTSRRRFDVYHRVAPVVILPKLSPRPKVNVSENFEPTITDEGYHEAGTQSTFGGTQQLSTPAFDPSSYYPFDASFSLPDELPLSVLRALQCLPKDRRPSSQDIRDIAAQKQVSLREALAILLVGEERVKDLHTRASEAQTGHGTLKLCLWMQPGDAQEQILAASVALLHCAVELDLKDCDPCDCVLLSPWLALRKVKLQGCARLESLEGLQHCTYLESISLKKCIKLQEIKHLGKCTQLKHIDLEGCISVNPAEVWNLALHAWVNGCEVVWPSAAMLKKEIQKHRADRLATENVIQSALSGARHQLQAALVERDMPQFQRALKYAKAFGLEVQEFEERYRRMKMHMMLSEEDVALLLSKNSRKWRDKASRCAALAHWMSIRKGGLTFLDVTQALESIGYENPHCSIQAICACIIQDPDGLIQRSDFALLDGPYQGPATIIDAVDFWLGLLKAFDNMNQVVSYLFEVPGSTLSAEQIHEKLVPKMGERLTIGLVAGLVKLLDYSRDGRIKEAELRFLEFLQGLVVYKKFRNVLRFLENKHGNFDKAFVALDSNRSGSVNWNEFTSMFTPEEVGCDEDEVLAMSYIIDEDGNGGPESIFSRADWNKMQSLPRIDTVVSELRALYMVIRQQFSGEKPVSEAFAEAYSWQQGGRGNSKDGARRGSKEQRGSVSGKRGSQMEQRGSVVGGSKDRGSISVEGRGSVVQRGSILTGKVVEVPSKASISLDTFLTVCDSWGFTGIRLTPERLFKTVLDWSHGGAVNAQEFALLELFAADDVRNGVQHLQSFLKQRFNTVEASYVWMAEMKKNSKGQEE